MNPLYNVHRKDMQKTKYEANLMAQQLYRVAESEFKAGWIATNNPIPIIKAEKAAATVSVFEFNENN